VQLLTGALGLAIICVVLFDAFEAIVLPRRVTRKARLTRLFYRSTWRLWVFAGRLISSPKGKQAYLSIYGPASLLALLGIWAIGLIFGYGVLFWSLGSPLHKDGPRDFWSDMYFSGTTFLTLGLGDVTPTTPLAKVVTVVETATGFGLLAMVIGYLPVIYQAFSRREVVIALLDARAGTPSSAGELLRRHASAGGMEGLDHLLQEWERWAAELLESHISYPVLAYFRAQHNNQSWLAALTTMLDTCAIVINGLEGFPAWQARLSFAISRHTVVDLAQILAAPPAAPQPERLSSAEFARLEAMLRKARVPLRPETFSEARVAELRAMYEPFVNSLAQRLMLTLPPWMHVAGTVDNWRTSAWGRISNKSTVLPIADTADEEHS
jgi:Ion channel